MGVLQERKDATAINGMKGWPKQNGSNNGKLHIFMSNSGCGFLVYSTPISS